jgi:catechol 2,3-dioxygenase-like lactoylglutathione lyase family enzyme
VVAGVGKVVIEVEDQARALAIWTEMLGFEVHQDVAYGDESWVEVRTPDGRLGWWSLFEDQEGNRFALHPRERGEPR